MNRSIAIGLFFFAIVLFSGTASAIPFCDYFCFTDIDCDDSNASSYDFCRYEAMENSYCTNNGTRVYCINDSDCADNNTSTIDVCNNDGEATSYCVIVSNPADHDCATNADCDDDNPDTNNICHIQEGHNNWCSDHLYDDSCCPEAGIACYNDGECDDSNSCTIDICNNDGTCESACANIEFYDCSDDGDCADSDPLTRSLCINPATCDSYCNQNYAVFFGLINEETGCPFDLADINVLQVYSPDFNFSFDFKETGDNNLWVDTNSFGESLRFEMQHTLGSSFTRDFDLEVIHKILILTGDANFRICVPEYQTLYAQYLESNQIRPVAVYNPTSNCYIIADFTKYAYQTAYLATAFSIDMPYILYMWDSNNARIVLADIEGAIASEINLDTLEFGLTTYSIIVSREGIHVSRAYDETLLFHYKDLAGDNASVNIKVYDDTTEIFDYTETDLPNEFSVYFDHTELEISADLLRVVVTTTSTSGDVESFTTYFTVEGFAGVLNPQLAIIIAFVFFVFALTFVAYRFALGWFGILSGLVAIAILTLAPPTWYVRFAQGIIVIIVIFIGLIFKEETAKVT